MNNITRQYSDDRRWSDRFLPEIKGILGRRLIENSSEFEDCNNATDLVFPGKVKIAVRVRKYDVYQKYQKDITVRYSTRNGHLSEWYKIMQGKADLMFYAFCNEDETKIIAFSIIDLKTLVDRIDDVTIGALTAKDGPEFRVLSDIPSDCFICKCNIGNEYGTDNCEKSNGNSEDWTQGSTK